MPTQTYTEITSITLAASASTVTFSNIPQNYKHLIFSINIVGSSSGNPRFNFNGDAGNNYYLTYMDGYAASNGSGFDNGQTSQSLTYSPAVTNQSFTASFNIMDYAAGDKHKSSLIRSGSGLGSVSTYATRWASMAAVNSITFSNYTYLAGSTFTLYGIVG